MKISRLEIKNYRSIGSDGITIDFFDNVSAFIGRNNTGKSNIMSVLNILLGSRWPSDYSFSIDDFHKKNVENDIEFNLYFDTAIDDVKVINNWYEHKFKVYGFKLEYKTYKRNTAEHKKGELHLDFTCIDKKGKTIRLPTDAPRKGNRTAFLSSFTDFLRVKKKYREQIEFISIPTDRRISEHLPSKSKSLIGTLVSSIREDHDYKNETIKIPKEIAEHLKTSEEVSRIELFEVLINWASQVAKSDEIINVGKVIEKYVKEQLGENFAEKVEFQIELQNIWNQFRYFDLTVQHSGIELPVTRLGSGFQSILVISIFRAISEIKGLNPIICIEEPELFLHPHAKKYFYSIIRNLGDSGIQIIYTTHSSEFLEVTHPNSIKRLTKENDVTTLHPEKALAMEFTSSEKVKYNSAFDNERSELFFADRVMLVEGQTEKLIYNYLFNLKGINPNQLNYSIIETAGKGGIPKFMEILEHFTIPYCVVYDSDILTLTGDEDRDKRINENNSDAVKKNENIKKSGTTKENLFCNEPYLEYTIGLTENENKKNDSKPTRALDYLLDQGTYKDISDKFPNLLKPIEHLIK